MAIECKINALSLVDSPSAMAALAKNFKVFRGHYPNGDNVVVSSDIETPFERVVDGVRCLYMNVHALIEKIGI